MREMLFVIFMVLVAACAGCADQLAKIGLGDDAPRICEMPDGSSIMERPSLCSSAYEERRKELYAARVEKMQQQALRDQARREIAAKQPANHAVQMPPSRPVTVTASNGETCTTTYYGEGPVDPGTLDAIKKGCERQQRGKAILAITGPTEADLMAMSPTDRAKAVMAMRCRDVREKLEVQRDMEAAGSTGVYNKSMLLLLERQACGSNAAP